VGRILGGGALFLVLLVVAWSATAQASGAPAGFTESTVATGLRQPTAIAFLPDGGLLVTEKGGALKLVRAGSVSLLTTLPVCPEVSMGLLGIAVDPGFSANGHVYVYRTVAGAGGCGTEAGRFNRVGRLTLSGDAVVDGPVNLPFAVRTDNGQHNGGTLRVGIDGKLYLSTGDTGVGDFKGGGAKTLPGESANPFAQDLTELPGKVLRVNLDGSIPADNPFAGQAGARGEIFAYGFRNPFRFGIDPVTGLLWLGDVGQSTWEELNVIRRGGN
jgi:glucose/arabinose dehydrogenase